MFWSTQPILKLDNHSDENIISNYEKKDLKLVIPPQYKWTDPKILLAKDKESKLLDFIISANSNTNNQSSVPMTKELLNWIKEMDGIFVCLEKGNRYIGFACLIPINIRIDRRKLKIGYTTFLCVRPEYRKKGLAPFLIKKLKETAYPIQIGYHMVPKKIGTNAIPINIWLRPLNYRLCKSLNLYSGQADQFKDLYQQSSLKNIELEKANEKDLCLLNKEYKIRLETKQFQKICRMPHMQIFKVKELGVLIGYLGYRMEHILFKNKLEEKIMVAWIYFIWGDDKLFPILLDHLYQNYKNCPYLLIHEMGNMTESILQKNKAVMVDQKWLAWYNWSGKYDKNQIFLPIF